MNLAEVLEVLSRHEPIKCHTCGGVVNIEAENAPDAPEVHVIVNCHGMWGIMPVRRDGSTDADLVPWLMDEATRIPERVPEYEVSEDAPRVKGHQTFPVSQRTVCAARLGAEMQIDGVCGVVTGINRGSPAITLSKSFP